MSEQETVIMPPPEASANGDVPGPDDSLLEQLRARSAQLRQEYHYDLIIPGYGGQLGLRLGPVSERMHTRLAERAAQDAPVWQLNADLLIAGCQDVLVRGTEDDPWQSLGAFDGNGPVRVDGRLARLLALEPAADTAREVLRALFGKVPSPEWAMTVVTTGYVTWNQGADEGAEEAFQGES